MARTISILYDALQEALRREIIDEWSVAGMNVVLSRHGHAIQLPALKARAFLQTLIRNDDRDAVDHNHADERCKGKTSPPLVLDRMVEESLETESFNKIVNEAVRDLAQLKKRKKRSALGME